MVELWFFYVFSAMLIWGFNAIIDKFILTKHLNAFSYLVAYIPAGLVVLAGILLSVPIDFNSISYYLAFFAGMISVVGYYLYSFAMKKEEVSRISALSCLYPAFVAVFAGLILKEIFSLRSYMGIALMILGAILISYKRSSLKKTIPIIVILMIIGTNFAYGFEQTISKLSLQHFSFLQFFAAYLIGKSFTVIPSLAVPSFRRNLIGEFRRLRKSIILLLAFSSSFWLLGAIFFFYAASLGPITFVSTISILSPFITLFVAVFFTRFLPKILKEEIDSKTFSLKLFSIILIVFGTYLITV